MESYPRRSLRDRDSWPLAVDGRVDHESLFLGGSFVRTFTTQVEVASVTMTRLSHNAPKHPKELGRDTGRITF